MYLTRCLLLGLVYPAHVLSANRFLRPPSPGPLEDFRDNPVFTLGETVDFHWETDYKAVDVVMWQQQPKGSSKMVSAKLATSSKSEGMMWKVTYAGLGPNHDPEASQVYFLQFSETGSNSPNETSHYFNITEPTSTTTTRATSSASTSTGMSWTTMKPNGAGVTDLVTTPPATSSAAAVTDTQTLAEGSGLSDGAVAGIAIGAILGFLAVVGVSGFVIWRHLRRKRTVREVQVRKSTFIDDHRDTVQLHEKDATAISQWKLELPASTYEPHELGGFDMGHEMSAGSGWDKESQKVRLSG